MLELWFPHSLDKRFYSKNLTGLKKKMARKLMESLILYGESRSHPPVVYPVRDIVVVTHARVARAAPIVQLKGNKAGPRSAGKQVGPRTAPASLILTILKMTLRWNLAFSEHCKINHLEQRDSVQWLLPHAHQVHTDS